MVFKALLSLALAQLAVAQYGGPLPTTTGAAAAPSAPANTPGRINVDVFPNGNFTFSPASITASPGDLVIFWFPTNMNLPHSVTQSSFEEPCTHLAATGNNSAGFDSSLVLGVQFVLNITSTDPIWFHCKQVGHCGMGMVGSINAPASGNRTHDAFVTAAKAIGGGEVTETDSGSPVLSGVNATPVGPPGASAGSGALKVAAQGGLYLAAAGVLMYLL